MRCTKHIESISAEISRTLGHIKHHLKLSPPQLRQLASDTYIRRKLEYLCVCHLDPNQYLINHFEVIMNRAARFICSSFTQDASRTVLKRYLRLVPLNTPRIISRLLLLHKCYHHQPHAHISVSEHLNKGSAHLNNSQGTKRISGHITAFNGSFFTNSIVTWNNLLPHISCRTDFPKCSQHGRDHVSLLPD